MIHRRPTRWIARAAGLALALTATIAAGTALTAAPASAATCPARSVSKPFTGFGDSNDYFLAPAGAFESGAPGWSQYGTSLVANNEPWRVNGYGSYGLRIGANGSASTPSMCIATAEDSMRFFYKAPGVGGSALQVFIEVTSGVKYATNQFNVDGTSSGWNVSPRIMLPDIRDASGVQYVKITFRPVNTQAPWVIDDVEIDPWRTL